MTEPVKISLCIITYNEEENLADCLASARWVDEILLVDSGSTAKAAMSSWKSHPTGAL